MQQNCGRLICIMTFIQDVFVGTPNSLRYIVNLPTAISLYQSFPAVNFCIFQTLTVISFLS
jgi:hypothetical protein